MGHRMGTSLATGYIGPEGRADCSYASLVLGKGQMSKHLYRSRYALAILHVHVMIYKDGDLLTAEEKNCSKQRKNSLYPYSGLLS